MPYLSCGVFCVGQGTTDLWPSVAIAAPRSECFLIEVAPDNADVVSISELLLRPRRERLSISALGPEVVWAAERPQRDQRRHGANCW